MIIGNQFTFVSKELFIEKLKIWNKYLKWPSRTKHLAYKKIKNKCNSQIEKSKRKYLENINSKETLAVKPFMINTNDILNDSILI